MTKGARRNTKKNTNLKTLVKKTVDNAFKRKVEEKFTCMHYGIQNNAWQHTNNYQSLVVGSAADQRIGNEIYVKDIIVSGSITETAGPVSGIDCNPYVRILIYENYTASAPLHLPTYWYSCLSNDFKDGVGRIYKDKFIKLSATEVGQNLLYFSIKVKVNKKIKFHDAGTNLPRRPIYVSMISSGTTVAESPTVNFDVQMTYRDA